MCVRASERANMNNRRNIPHTKSEQIENDTNETHSFAYSVMNRNKNSKYSSHFSFI